MSALTALIDAAQAEFFRGMSPIDKGILLAPRQRDRADLTAEDYDYAAAALDGAPEPEWEEVVQYGNLTSLGFIQETRGRNYAMHKRIVRFGPVLPAQGESDE